MLIFCEQQINIYEINMLIISISLEYCLMYIYDKSIPCGELSNRLQSIIVVFNLIIKRGNLQSRIFKNQTLQNTFQIYCARNIVMLYLLQIILNKKHKIILKMQIKLKKQTSQSVGSTIM